MKLSKFERIIGNIIINAGEKIIDSATLHGTKYSYRSAYFLAVVAQEELAKLIILPFAREAGKMNEILENRKSSFFRHPIKQKIFVSYGLQNRTAIDLEKIKQECLYIDGHDKRRVIEQKVVYEEIKHTIDLYMKFAFKNTVLRKGFSNDFKEVISKFTKKILDPAIDDLMPGLEDDIIKSYETRARNIKIDDLLYEEMTTNPYMFIDLVKHRMPKNYKRFFSEIEKMSFKEAIQHYRKYL